MHENPAYYLLNLIIISYPSAVLQFFLRGNPDSEAGAHGVKRGRFGEVSGVIHFYYHVAPAGGRSGKLFLKQSGARSLSHQSYYLAVAESSAGPTEGDSQRASVSEG